MAGVHAVAAALLASAMAFFAYMAYRMLRSYFAETEEGPTSFVELYATLVFALLAAMSLVALTVTVSASTP